MMKTTAQERLKELAAPAGSPSAKPGSEAWFLGLDPAKQKDYLTKNPTSKHATPHKTKLKLKHRAKKGLATKAKTKALNGLTPRTGLATAATARLASLRQLASAPYKTTASVVDYLSGLGWFTGPFTEVPLKFPKPYRVGVRVAEINLKALPPNAMAFNKKYTTGSAKMIVVPIARMGFLSINLKTSLVIVENTANRTKVCDLAEGQLFLAKQGIKKFKEVTVLDVDVPMPTFFLKDVASAQKLVHTLGMTPQSGAAARFVTAMWSVYQVALPGVGLVKVSIDRRASVPPSVMFPQRTTLDPVDTRTS